jgi:hypothetical protein
MKNRKLFTNEELNYIKERHDQQIADKLDRMINRAAKVTTLVNTVSNVSQGLKMLQGLKQQSKLNALEIQKVEQDVANKKQLAESTKNIAEQNKYKAEQEKQKSVQEMHKVTQEYFKGQKEKQSAYADAYSKFNQSYKDFFDTEKTKKEYSDWINQNTKSDRKVYTLKNATVKDILNQRNSTHESELNSKAAYKFRPSGVNISQLANRHSQNASVISQQVMETRISDLSKSPYTSAMATNAGRPYANRTINSMLNNMTTEYYQRQIPSSSDLKEMLKNSKGNYSFYNMLL